MLLELQSPSQITLPQFITEHFGLTTGDKFSISERDGGIFLMPIKPAVPKKEMTQEEWRAFLDEFYGCIDDPTMTEPPEIEYESPREQIL